MTNHNLTTKAMLVNLSLRSWSANKNDKQIAREVAANHGATGEVGKYTKHLLPGVELLAKIKKYGENEIRQGIHYRLSLPWLDGGIRILSSEAYFTYSEALSEKRAVLEPMVEEFCTNYPQYVEAAELSLPNGLFRRADYPSTASIRHKFECSVEILPFPTTSDFRTEMSDAAVAQIKRRFESDQDVRLQQATTSIWHRLRDVVQHMSNRLKLYKPDAPKAEKNPFRDTLVANIKSLLDIIPMLNVTDDPDIKRFAAEIKEQLTVFTCQELREVDAVRATTAQRADAILERMEAYL